MLNEDIYNKSIEFAKRTLNIRKLNNEDPYDIVHDLILCENSLTEENYKKRILDAIFLIGKASNIHVDIERISSGKKITTDRQCRNCNEVLPESCFKQSWSNQTKSYYIRNSCKKCYSGLYLETIRVWRKNNKERIKAKCYKDRTAPERQKKFQERQKNELTDYYIVKILTRRLYKKEDLTQDMIVSKRDHIIEFRNKKANK